MCFLIVCAFILVDFFCCVMKRWCLKFGFLIFCISFLNVIVSFFLFA